MELNRTAPLDVVLVINLKQSSPLCAQSVMQRLHDAGHHVTLFARSAQGKLIPILEDPLSPLNTVYERPQELLRDKICESDAVILITDHPVCEVPDYLTCHTTLQRPCVLMDLIWTDLLAPWGPGAQ